MHFVADAVNGFGSTAHPPARLMGLKDEFQAGRDWVAKELNFAKINHKVGRAGGRKGN